MRSDARKRHGRPRMNTNNASAEVCGFALDGDRYCRRPKGHAATDGRVVRHDSSPPTTCPDTPADPASPAATTTA